MKPTARKQIFTYLIITFALSAIFWVLIFTAGTTSAFGGGLTIGLMWMPGVSAILTNLIYRRSLRGLGWNFGQAKYLALAYVLPILYALPVYAITWLAGLGGFSTANLPPDAPWPAYLPVAATLIFLVGALPGALGEEIGWRGLLVPQLARERSFTSVALISGIIWVVWHAPLILFSDYRSDTPAWYALLSFTFLVMGISFAFAWLRLKSNSLWPAAILHASHNLFIQVVFDPLTINTGITAYITTEFGAGLALTGVITALIFWRLAQKEPSLAALPVPETIQAGGTSA